MASLDAILDRYVTKGDGHLNSLQAASFVVTDKNGNILYSKTLGKQRLDDDSPAFTEDTVCWIASLSKLITSVCVLQIVEKGLIGLDDDVGKVVPELSGVEILNGFDSAGQPLMSKSTAPITLRRLLTHSSGLSYIAFDPHIQKWAAAVRPNEPLPSSAELKAYVMPLKFNPGEKWMYSVSIDWAGRVLELLCNTTLEEYIQEHICKPTGMTSTVMNLAARPDLLRRRAEIGLRNSDGRLVQCGQDLAITNRTVMGGGGGLFSTASDYSKFVTSLIKNDGKLLTPSSVTALYTGNLTETSRTFFQEQCDGAFHASLTPEFPIGTPVDYGLGGCVNLEDVPEKRKAGSVMWSGLTNPHWWIDPKSGIAAVIMAQVLQPGDPVVNKMYDELEKALYSDLLKDTQRMQHSNERRPIESL